MGNSQSGKKGGSASKLSQADLERMQRRFQRLSTSSGGRVSISQVQSMVELGANPFVPRIFQIFDSDNDGFISLEEFTKALELFGGLDDPEEQYQFAFKIYDLNGDGVVSSEELFRMLQGLVGLHYTEAQLEQIVMSTMSEFDADGDNSLNFEEFKNLLSGTDLQAKFAMSL